MATNAILYCGRLFFHILCMVILWYTTPFLFQNTGFHGISRYFTMVYLFQNTMVFTIEYDGILTNNLWFF